MISDATLAFGDRVMTALLGIDALYRSESGDSVGLAVLNLDTENRFVADTFGTYADARDGFESLQRDAAGLPEADRRLYYDQLCRSTLAFAAWREDGLAFDHQLEQFLHVPAEAASDAQLQSLCSDIDRLLSGMGFSGDLAAKCAQWEDRNRVPADEVPGVIDQLMSDAWDRTEERLMPIPADKSDGMRVRPVTGVPYNARCDYHERTVELNVEPTLTRPGLKHLCVHEGYPGHYLQFKLRETMAREGTAPADVLLSVVNSASSSVFEGIADTGMAMIDWIETDDDRVQVLLNRQRAGIATGAAWRLHALGWPADRVKDWLAGQTLVGGSGWIENRMGFISVPERAVLIWSYWWGEPVVTKAWESTSEQDRQPFLRYLYGRMHSADSVGLFTP